MFYEPACFESPCTPFFVFQPWQGQRFFQGHEVSRPNRSLKAPVFTNLLRQTQATLRYKSLFSGLEFTCLRQYVRYLNDTSGRIVPSRTLYLSLVVIQNFIGRLIMFFFTIISLPKIPNKVRSGCVRFRRRLLSPSQEQILISRNGWQPMAQQAAGGRIRLV